MKAEFGKSYLIEGSWQVMYEILARAPDNIRVLYSAYDSTYKLPGVDNFEFKKIISEKKRKFLKPDSNYLTMGAVKNNIISKLNRGAEIIAIEGVQNIVDTFGESDLMDIIASVKPIVSEAKALFVLQANPNKLENGTLKNLQNHLIYARELTI